MMFVFKVIPRKLNVFFEKDVPGKPSFSLSEPPASI